MSLHHRAKEVFLGALDRPDTDRPAFVAEACAGDPLLKQEVESLLEHHNREDTSEQAAPSTDTEFTPGEVFVGRYRMIARIGRGGMGDVWRAEDLVLATPVALKMIVSTGPEARERLLNEVRLARQITHPAICRVFDVGESERGIFYTMELVQGETLASLVRRVGRLPSDKVADIARQLCAGLAAAHARGVLHRDLKPANILIDDEGLVRITDFGIAIPRTSSAQHMLTGTPAYMAPEQRVIGTPLSERTDVYSLGLVLYEILVGQHPFSGVGAGFVPARPSTVAPNVHPQLERVILQALSADPGDRPASAADLAAGIPDIGTRRDTGLGVATAARRPRGQWWVAGLGVAVVVGVLAVAASLFFTPRPRTLNEQDTIVLADFENTTGEAVFDGALKVALAVALEQSPFLRVFPDARARETLRLMRQSPDERITQQAARGIAQRERLKALISGSIASLGRNYVLTLEAINAETGDVMAREQAEAPSKEQVLTSLGAATSRLREKLGESLASIKQFDVPLPRATTESLEALHAYSLALYQGREVPRLEAIPHLKRAIEIDPTFAMAYAQLSAVYANTGQSSLAPDVARAAFELKDRVSEREQFFISWRYYRDALQSWAKGLELARSWTATYPREAFAFNSLGSALLSLGQFEEAVEPFRQAIRLDPAFIPSYSNLAATLLALNRNDEASDVLREAADRQLDFAGARRLSYLLAFVQGDRKTMDENLEASVGVGETNAAFGWQAHTTAFAGQIRTAHEQFRRGIQRSQGQFDEVAARLTMEDAEMHAIVGQCSEAVAEVPFGLALSRDNLTLERASRVFALCGDAAESRSLSAELSRRFPDATLIMGVSVPVIEAALALQQREPVRALSRLDLVTPYDRAPSGEFWPSYLRGQAALQQKDGRAAAGHFQSIIDRRGEVPASMLYPLAQLALGRARALMGEIDGARASYDAFLASWPEADPDLQPLIEAKLERSQLK